MTIAAGTRLDRYEIRDLLGEGGMGEVYRARDTRLDRVVALKLLPAALTRDPDRVRRFIQEAKAVSALNHPNIVTIHEIGDCDAGRFIVMELVQGRTLRQLDQPCALALTGRPRPSDRQSLERHARRRDHAPRHQAGQHHAAR